MFEKASRMKLRFAYKGQCSVEDLWDMPVEELDSIYKKLRSHQRTEDTDSLLENKNSQAGILTLSIDIVKHIVTTKLAEDKAKKNRAENRIRKQKILEIISNKQEEDLKGKSMEDLNKMLDEIDVD